MRFLYTLYAMRACGVKRAIDNRVKRRIFGSLDNGETQMKTQRNLRKIEGGGWVVELRQEGDPRWITIYCGGSRQDALAAYRRLK